MVKFMKNNITNLLIHSILFLMFYELINFCNISIQIKSENYDFSQISEIKGTILEVKIRNDSFYGVIEFEDDNIRSIYMGNSLKYSIGDEINFYTDGKYYGLSKENCFYKSSNIMIFRIIKMLTIMLFIFFYIPICIFFFFQKRNFDEREKEEI